MNNLIIWPKSEDVVHINYHYTQFGEIVDYLKNKKIDVSSIDCDINNIDIIDFIGKNNITKIAMHVNYENSVNSFKLAKKIKNKFNNILLLAYGPLTVMLPRLFINSNIDAIFKDGDFETCIESFFNNYKSSDNLLEKCNELIGIYVINNNSLVPTRQGKFINADEWGMSREENVPVAEYDRKKGKNRYVINVSRGCPYGCSHCLIQLTEGRKERRRSIDNLDNVINSVKDRYKHIKIWAANFTLNQNYVKKFCEIMRKNHSDVTWECATRIDLVNDKQLLEEMHSSGCRQISLGIESLNNEELIHTKDFSKNQIFKAISNINNSGIQVKACIMLGMPNQTKESIINTLRFLKENNVIIRPTIYTPYHNLSDNIDVNELTKYNRKTLRNNSVEGVTADQLLQLVKTPYEFEDILNIDNENRKVNEKIKNTISPKEIAKMTKDGIISNPGYISKQLQEFSKELKEKSMEDKEK